MSSTNRNAVRNDADYYRTPLKPVRDFLEVFLEDEKIDLSNITVLDPCAGGIIGKEDMTYPKVLEELGANNIKTLDIRKDSPADHIADFLDTKSLTQFDLVITNPPFNIAQQIIEKSLEFCKDGGYVVMLLRLNYLGSKSRKDFWKNNVPDRIYVHNKRISFTENGDTDSIEYAHFVWKKGEELSETRLKLINGF